MRLNENERTVLEFLADQSASGERYWGFDGIAQHTKLERRVIRLACRSLRRKGLTEFLSGLWNDEGPAGSGYAATKAAAEALSSQPWAANAGGNMTYRERIIEVLAKYNVRLDDAPLDALAMAMERKADSEKANDVVLASNGTANDLSR